LLKLGFCIEFITPIVKAKKGKEVKAFYTLPEYEAWKVAFSSTILLVGLIVLVFAVGSQLERMDHQVLQGSGNFGARRSESVLF
jgi:hypothetical protein